MNELNNDLIGENAEIKAISEIKKQRISDIKTKEALLIENSRLKSRLSILEHSDIQVAELGSRIEQILTRYIETEDIRINQAAQIAKLKQEIAVLKSRMNKS